MYCNSQRRRYWHWSGIDTAGRACRGFLEASNRKEVHLRLLEDGVTPLKVQCHRSIGTPRCSASQLTTWLSHLHQMLEASITLSQALKLLQYTLQASALMLLTQQVRAVVARGSALSEALERSPHAYCPPLDSALLSAAERSSDLLQGLYRLVENRQRRQHWARACQHQLRYPTVLMIAGMATLWLMMAMVVPGFAQLYAQSRHSLPMLTRGTIALANALNVLALPLGGGTVITLMLIRWHRSHPFIARAESMLPILSHLKRLQLSIALLECLSLSRSGNTALLFDRASILDGLLKKIQLGMAAGTPLSVIAGSCQYGHRPLFPVEVIHLMSIAERTGRMDVLIEDARGMLEHRTTHYLTQLTGWLEPLLLAMIGGLVGLLMLSIYLPLLDMKELMT